MAGFPAKLLSLDNHRPRNPLMEDSEPGRIEAALVTLGYRAVTDVRAIGGGWESEIWRADTSSGPRAVRVFVGPDRTHDAWQEGSVIARLGRWGTRYRSVV